MSNVRTFFRYLPVSATSKAREAYVLDAGFAFVPAGTAYPPRQHPDDHHFTWEAGRRLMAHQFLYITRGKGIYESAVSGTLDLQAGDLFIVFPGVWHRYRPDPATGWDEYWVEMDGEYLWRLLRRPEFSPSRPKLALGIHPPLLHLFLEAVKLVRQQPAEYEFLLGALAVQIIANTVSALKQADFANRPVAQIIREAKRQLALHGGRPAPLEGLATEFNLSYSTFRRLFKRETGYSPRQFGLNVCIQRANDLLLHTNTPVQAIAESLGFESVHYFSRLFKQKTGRAPSEVRTNAAQAAVADHQPTTGPAVPGTSAPRRKSRALDQD